MKVTAIKLSAIDSTKEIQDWLDIHPPMTISTIVPVGQVVFIFYD